MCAVGVVCELLVTCRHGVWAGIIAAFKKMLELSYIAIAMQATHDKYFIFQL